MIDELMLSCFLCSVRLLSYLKLSWDGVLGFRINTSLVVSSGWDPLGYPTIQDLRLSEVQVLEACYSPVLGLGPRIISHALKIST